MSALYTVSLTLTLTLTLSPASRLLALALIHHTASPEPNFAPYYSSTMQMAADIGVNISRHDVLTEDGYWLTAHRLGNPLGTPVLLVHGLLASSDQWLLMGRHGSYALVLGDAGYDVWLANTRGNVYSRRHHTLSPDLDPQFWNFSMHEIGYYDLPAMVEYISRVTGHSKMFYSGYSVGGTLFLIMNSARPEYSRRFLGAFLLAPLLVRPDISTVYKMGYEFLLSFIGKLKSQQIGEFYPRQSEMLRMNEEKCSVSAQTFPLCVLMMEKSFGLMPSEYEPTKLELLLKSFGSGTSTKVIEHIIQILKGGHLVQYDHGWRGNLQHYGTLRPPEYNLGHTTCPISLHYDKNDKVVDYKAVDLASKSFPCLLCNCMENKKGFSHFGYLISHRAYQYVFSDVIQKMRLLESEEINGFRCF